MSRKLANDIRLLLRLIGVPSYVKISKNDRGFKKYKKLPLFTIGIHGVGRRIVTTLQRIRNSTEISERNREPMLKFYEDLCLTGISNARILRYIHSLDVL